MRRLRLVARGLADPKAGARSLSTHCEVAAMLARRSGLEGSVVDALAHAYERWDGKGIPAGLAGDAVPLAVRIACVARDADLAIGWARGTPGPRRDNRVRGGGLRSQWEPFADRRPVDVHYSKFP
jgi:HD domain